jgi:hypothetical protein
MSQSQLEAWQKCSSPPRNERDDASEIVKDFFSLKIICKQCFDETSVYMNPYTCFFGRKKLKTPPAAGEIGFSASLFSEMETSVSQIMSLMFRNVEKNKHRPCVAEAII